MGSMSLLAPAIALDAQPYQILAYLEARQIEAHADARYCRPVDQFYVPEAMHNDVEAARAWWPTQAAATLPNYLTWGQAFASCLAAYGNNDASRDIGTLVDHMRAKAEQVTEWLAAQGVDTERPNETPAERRKRLGRERVAKWRAEQRDIKAGAGEPEHVRIARQQTLTMRSQLKHERAKAKDANRDAYTAMLAVAAAGKERVAWAEEQVRLADQYLADALDA